MLIVIPKVFTKAEIGLVKRQLEQADWQDGLLTAGDQARSVKRNQQLADNSALAQKLGDVVLDALAQQPQFMSAALPLKIFPPMFNRYQGGETYGIHVDNAVRFVPGTPTRVRSDLSATLFLSEPEDYEGGELHIQEQFGEQKIKLAAGDMILYPSSSLHQVLPVIHGQRLACVLWIQSMVRDNEQRQMLFDLDQSIQSLSAEQGHQNSDVMRLTGIYQNLLRQWAET
jgi:PKHD-type hydroxylase